MAAPQHCLILAMDADFLKKHVGDALTGGMSAVNLYQPADPVEFLGQYLLKYVANAEQNERVGWKGKGFRGPISLQVLSCCVVIIAVDPSSLGHGTLAVLHRRWLAGCDLLRRCPGPSLLSCVACCA